ncbi:MAG: sigma 54-interacting transcriptional regulator [Deltaproteobacteria bacterium]|nr:sigma 54-interacting transcriptional regulator [Deltaproteobacteria bacterium]
MDFAGGRYRLIKRLGAGGEGEVWLARDRLRPGLDVALKRMPLSGRKDLVRFLRGEFQVLSTLEHPRLARVHDLGAFRDEDGGPSLYFTRDFVSGSPLEIPGGGMEVKEALGIALEITRALRPLHRSGLVHGDLKPGNVIVDDRQVVHLIDFALAGTLDQGTDGLPTGTLLYMSPEMLEGKVPDGRGDLYAIGVMLVELLTGEPPFGGEPDAVIHGHLAGNVDLPGAWKPRRGSRPGRAALSTIIRKLSAREPALRYPSLDEAEAALMRALPGAVEDPDARRAPVGGMHARARERDRVLALMQSMDTSSTDGPATIVVLSERGCGRSSFLRALRWELQVRGERTLDLDMSRERSPDEQVRSLLMQLAWSARSSGIDVDPELERFASQPGRMQGRRMEALAGSMAAALAREAPIAVMIDDFHRSSTLTSRLLRVIGTAARSSCRFVTSAVVGREDELPLLGAGPREEVLLSGLTDEDLAAMIRAALGREDARLAGRIREASGGNPALASHFLERVAQLGPRLDGVEDEPLPDRLSGLWRGRLEGISPAGRRVIDALAVHARPVRPEWIGKLLADVPVEPVIRGLVQDGLVDVRSDGGLAIQAGALSAIAREDLAGPRFGQLHEAWADVLERNGGDEHLVILHRACSGRASDVAAMAVEATKRLRSLGNLVEAEKMLTVVDGELHGRGEVGWSVRLGRAQILHDMGRSSESLNLLESMDAGKPGVVLALSRALAGVGRREEAVACLERLADDPDSGEESGPARRELALQFVHLGRFEDALRAADEGLDRLAVDQDAARADLLCTRSLSLLYDERLDEAAAGVTEALGLARRVHDGRLRTRAHWILAMIHQRRGDLYEAAASYRQSIDICTRTDDTGNMANLLLNLGTLLHRMGEVEEALDRYLGAMDYARSAGRAGEAVLARINLGLLLAQLGLSERARLEAGLALAEAERLGRQDLVARATGVAAEAAWWSGGQEQAVSGWRRSLEIHERLGARWEAAETRLDLAASLAADHPGGTDEAAALVAEAGAFLEGAASTLLEIKLSLARARIALARGDAGLAVELSRTALASCRRIAPEWDDYSWQAFSLMAEAHRRSGSDLLFSRTIKRAGEALEEAALKVPSRFARAFASSGARKRLFDEIDGSEADPGQDGFRTARGHQPGSGSEGEWRDTLMRLMELNRRLATTRDPEALVDVILDSAVEFTGAERGLLLLPAGRGRLEIASARDFYEVSIPEEHMEFSTSIARQVQASGQPVITVSAMEDERFDEARSVHELKLQSILCLPIKGRRAILGVLYLENRLRSGKFSESDRDLLAAFSDLLAIAMETARLLSESREQRAELERLSDARTQMLERRTKELDEARRDLRTAESRLAGKSVYRGLVGSTLEMRRIFSLIERIGENDVPVVVIGGSGTGKEMVARAIHAGEARRRGPFVAVNCGALPAELLESELFGHVRGAFTGAVRDKKGVFASASGGSLLLDEVGDMPSKMQLDLLRVLQEGVVRPVGSETEQSVDVRVIAASQRPLEQLVAEERFREDLYYRMRVVEVKLPALCERRDDIPLLIDHFLAAFALRFGTERKHVSRRAVRMLMEHPWPGNVRQLEHALLNAWVLSDERVLDAGDFESLSAIVPEAPSTQRGNVSTSSIEEEERRTILDALKAARWNKTEAAKRLGIPRRTFYRRLRKFGLLK